MAIVGERNGYMLVRCDECKGLSTFQKKEVEMAKRKWVTEGKDHFCPKCSILRKSVAKT